MADLKRDRSDEPIGMGSTANVEDPSLRQLLDELQENVKILNARISGVTVPEEFDNIDNSVAFEKVWEELFRLKKRPFGGVGSTVSGGGLGIEDVTELPLLLFDSGQSFRIVNLQTENQLDTASGLWFAKPGFSLWVPMSGRITWATGRPGTKSDQDLF